jgi:ABC-type glycerol-3-phosphate transport system substrate-binding protein
MGRRTTRQHRYRQVAGISVAAAFGLVAIAACTSSNSNPSDASTGGHVTFSIDCAPPTTEPLEHKMWLQDVAEFEHQNPSITVDSVYIAAGGQCEVPATFTAALDAGTETNVYYTYFTDLDQVLLAGQAADITPYINSTTIPNWNNIVPTARKAVTAGKTVYGIPASNYEQGLVYNRQLFTQAGLNPDDPPTTWAQVEADAAKIAKLGNGIWGYGDYSASNNGGWHLSSYVDAQGGTMVKSSIGSGGATETAGFDTQSTEQVLEALHTMRFTDHAMSPDQGLAWGTLQKQMAAGKLGMYIAAPDDVYSTIVDQDGGNVNNIGMGPLPSTNGTPVGSLSGGDDYMFAKRDTPAQIQAGVKFLNFYYLTVGQGYNNFARNKSVGYPVGFPEPELFQGSTNTAYQALLNKYATINTSYYAKFAQPILNGSEQPDGEPPDAQAVYKTLDPVMLAVLTESNANISQLLSTGAANVNTILANSGG